MCRVIRIRVDVDHVRRLWVPGPRAVRLTDRSGAHGDQHLGLFHRVVAADGSLRASNRHIPRMVVRNHTGHQWADHGDAVDRLQEIQQFGPCASRAAPDPQDGSAGLRQNPCGPLVRAVVHRRAQSGRRAAGKFIKIESSQCRRLRVHRHQQVERARTMRMIHGIQPAPQGRRQRLRGMQAVGGAHRREKLEEAPLRMTRNLLHVRAFVLGRLVSQQIPHTDPV